MVSIGGLKRYGWPPAAKTILSLFDYSGIWSKPYRDAGYHVVQVDIKHGYDIFDIREDHINLWEPYGILAAPPCTSFAASGRAHFKRKDEDGTTEASLRLIDHTLQIIEWARPTLMFWALEQPVGRLRKLRPIGYHKLWFHPYHYAGYLEDWETEAYSKMTLIYGEFNSNLIRKEVPNLHGSKFQLKYGGKSERVKTIRSTTPYGFSLAFFAANK